ncbi:MAG: hypothetical protein JO053_15160 [Acidobacteria bacterium]|nr:hypothetical protein [Acidobacteriota bacterium]
MSRNLYLLLIFVGCICASAFSISAQTSASATWRVQSYDLTVGLPSETNGRSAALRATLAVRNVSSAPAGTLTLRISTAAEVSAVQINGSAVEFGRSEEKINSAVSLQRIAIRLVPVAPGGTATAILDYKLTLKDNSGLAAISPAGSQFLPLSFWYPTPNSWYFARGADAAPFKIRVTGASQAVSAGAENAGSFEVKQNGQPFLLTGNWDVSTAGGVSVYMPKGAGAEAQKRAAELASLMSDARTFITGILGNAPDTPLKAVAVRRGAGYAGSGTVLVDESVFRRSKIDSATAMNVADAVAKLWLGGSISVLGDGHGVITEGLSRYLATQFIESKFGKDVADAERLRQRLAYASISERAVSASSISPLDDVYYTVAANKGAMVWRLLARRVGTSEFSRVLKASVQDGSYDLPELRNAFSSEKELLDHLLDDPGDLDLIIGIPVAGNGETTAALRNTGAIEVTVDVAATTSTGERIVAPATIRATSFGQVSFRTAAKITKVEIDTEKLYPQTDYSDDVAPREADVSDPLLAAKRAFDKQDYPAAESTARALLVEYPRLDDLRTLLGRTLLAENKDADASREMQAVLAEKLPSARSLAWANEVLAEAAAKANQIDQARIYADAAIAADGEYGASLAARNVRAKVGAGAIDPAIKVFFSDFDKAAVSNHKAEVDALVVPGEMTKFTSGLSGSTEQWQTQVTAVDLLDANTVRVQANLSIKLLNRNVETGLAVFRLAKVGTAWRLAAVDMFEVR